MDPTSFTNIHSISKNVGCITTGMSADSDRQALRCISEAAEYEYRNGYEMPVDLLAKRIANLNHVNTQQASSRPLGRRYLIGRNCHYFVWL